MAVSSDERAFLVAMGERIASLRKARIVTQGQLAEALGVSQQTPQAYEGGRRRIRAPQWQRQIGAVSQLLNSLQQCVARIVEAVLAPAGVR